MYDEAMAIAEVRALSDNTRSYLRHIWRSNSLQVIATGTEMNKPEIVIEEVHKISNELRRMGL